MRKRICRFLLVVGLCVLAVFLIDGIGTIRWVGYTDLTVEFAVTDAETGQPIEGVDVSIHSFGGLYAEREEMHLLLKTDRQGAAPYVCRNNMCGGTQSTLRFTNTFTAPMPDWKVVVNARAYLPTEPFWLADHSGRKSVKRTAPGQSKVVIPITLRKSP